MSNSHDLPWNYHADISSDGTKAMKDKTAGTLASIMAKGPNGASKSYILHGLSIAFLNTDFILFIWLCQGLSCSMQERHTGSSSLTRDQTWAPWIGSMESESLDHQQNPYQSFFFNNLFFIEG